MIELIALIGAALTIASMASERRMNVKLWVGSAVAGWVVLAVVFRFLLPLGLIFSHLGWVLVLGILAYVRMQKIPARIRTYEGLEALMNSMEESREHQEKAE